MYSINLNNQKLFIDWMLGGKEKKKIKVPNITPPAPAPSAPLPPVVDLTPIVPAPVDLAPVIFVPADIVPVVSVPVEGIPSFEIPGFPELIVPTVPVRVEPFPVLESQESSVSIYQRITSKLTLRNLPYIIVIAAAVSFVVYYLWKTWFANVNVKPKSIEANISPEISNEDTKILPASEVSVVEEVAISEVIKNALETSAHVEEVAVSELEEKLSLSEKTDDTLEITPISTNDSVAEEVFVSEVEEKLSLSEKTDAALEITPVLANDSVAEEVFVSEGIENASETAAHVEEVAGSEVEEKLSLPEKTDDTLEITPVLANDSVVEEVFVSEVIESKSETAKDVEEVALEKIVEEEKIETSSPIKSETSDESFVSKYVTWKNVGLGTVALISLVALGIFSRKSSKSEKNSEGALTIANAIAGPSDTSEVTGNGSRAVANLSVSNGTRSISEGIKRGLSRSASQEFNGALPLARPAGKELISGVLAQKISTCLVNERAFSLLEKQKRAEIEQELVGPNAQFSNRQQQLQVMQGQAEERKGIEQELVGPNAQFSNRQGQLQVMQGQVEGRKGIEQELVGLNTQFLNRQQQLQVMQGQVEARKGIEQELVGLNTQFLNRQQQLQVMQGQAEGRKGIEKDLLSQQRQLWSNRNQLHVQLEAQRRDEIERDFTVGAEALEQNRPRSQPTTPKGEKGSSGHSTPTVLGGATVLGGSSIRSSSQTPNIGEHVTYLEGFGRIPQRSPSPIAPENIVDKAKAVLAENADGQQSRDASSSI